MIPKRQARSILKVFYVYVQMALGMAGLFGVLTFVCNCINKNKTVFLVFQGLLSIDNMLRSVAEQLTFTLRV